LLAGCADPYEKELPDSGLLTPGQAEDIASRLQNNDKELFVRWAARMSTPNRFPGENEAKTVKIALVNESRFEAIDAEAKAKELAKRADEERAAEEARKEQREKDELAKRQLAANEEIKKYFVVEGITYDWVAVFGSYGLEVGRQWQFTLRLSNLSTKDIVGAKGWVRVTDVFGKVLGTYPARMEPHVKAGKSITFMVVMDYDKKDPGQVAMVKTQQIYFDWFFDSLAFDDGTTLDYRAIAAPPPDSSL
jgi:hypothetical protein